MNSLADLLIHVDERYDCGGFEHLLPIVSNDIVMGLSCLHSNDIAHRDLKPANFLVSNQHYMHLLKEEVEYVWQEGLHPIVCKLTDFGESRCSIIQTNTRLTSKVTKVDRGSPAYMAPEILLKEKRPTLVTLEDLQVFDIWALGMICFVLANPCFRNSYANEICEAVGMCPAQDARATVEGLIRSCQSPTFSQKYEQNHAVHWDLIVRLHKACICFNSSARCRSIKELEKRIDDDTAVAQCTVVNLCSSHYTAIEAQNSNLVNIIVVVHKASVRAQKESTSPQNIGKISLRTPSLPLNQKMITYGTKSTCKLYVQIKFRIDNL